MAAWKVNTHSTGLRRRLQPETARAYSARRHGRSRPRTTTKPETDGEGRNAAQQREEDASPDPWWHIGDVAIVFEDHANAGKDAVIDATKARQAASHPDWLREHVPGAAGATVQSVLVTPAKKAKQGAVPHLSRVSHWDLADFRAWADKAIDVVRELRRTFFEPGDLAWRAQAAAKARLLQRPCFTGFLSLLRQLAEREGLSPPLAFDLALLRKPNSGGDVE